MEVDLTNFELFKNFAEFKVDDCHVDLHNEFDCQSIYFWSAKKQLTLSFKPNEYCKQKINSVEVVFDDCIIECYSAKLNSDTDSDTIDVMYRGRFEIDNEELAEASDNGMNYYYIHLLPDTIFELFAKSVMAIVR